MVLAAETFALGVISIGETEISEVSRMTIVTEGDDKIIDQVVKQLNRLVDTIKGINLTGSYHIERELTLITVSYQKGSMEEIKNICDIFRGKIVDINNKTMMIEITGPPAKVDAAVNVLAPFGIKEMARSGIKNMKEAHQLVNW